VPGLALLWRRPQPIAAGLVLGVAAATKATAWPALIIAATMLLVRDGRRAVVGFLVAAVAAAPPSSGPWPRSGRTALVENTVLFPLGLASVQIQPGQAEQHHRDQVPVGRYRPADDRAADCPPGI